MSADYLMRKDGGDMYVPSAKLQEYLDDGWTVIKEPDEPVTALPTAAQPAPAESVAAAIPVVSLDEAVHKTTKSNSKKG